MIDTLSLFAPSALIGSDPVLGNHRHQKILSCPPNWNYSSHSFGAKKSFTYKNPGSGYHGHGHTDEVRQHRASLPRLLHGQNGKLIKSQADLDAALASFEIKAGEICEFRLSNHHFTRVDLVWQFEGDPADFILAHRHIRHPRIRKEPETYEINLEAHSLRIQGSEMKILIYDKSFEALKRKGKIVRVEVQLRSGILKQLLGNGKPVTRLDFIQCYYAYRQILLGLAPSPISNVSKIGEFLAIANREGWAINGVSAADTYLNSCSTRHKRRVQRYMATCRPSVHQIDWSQLLPPDGPPKAVDLEDKY
jgi:hypothetical protein